MQCWSHHFITLPIRTPRRSKKHMFHSRLPPASHTCCCRRVLSGNPNGTREEAHSFRHIDIHLKHIQHAQGPNSRTRSTCKKIRTFSVEEEEKREFTREEEEREARERGRERIDPIADTLCRAQRSNRRRRVERVATDVGNVVGRKAGEY